MRAAFSRLTLRARLLLVGVVGVAAALALGSAALYGVLAYAGYRTLDQGGRATAEDVAQLVAQGRLPDPVPVTGNQVVQVVDARDRVVSASVNADRLTAMLLPGELRSARTGRPVVVPRSRLGLDSPLRVVAEPVARTPRTVLVAQQFDDLARSRRVLGLTLLATYPVLLAVLAVIAWRVVGAALRPVEALRSSAERISGTGQDTRLPVPASGDEIHALAVTLNSMLARLAASRARQRSFVADAAHELRSPLTSMRTQLEVAEHVGERTPVLADLAVEVARMAALVEDLLTLARLDADVAPRATDGVVELRGLTESVGRRYLGARVPVAVLAGEQILACADEESLRRALTNLVDNAVRHAASGVCVSAARVGTRVVVRVSDDGAGIDPVDRERVFERFTRLDDARDRDTGGSGLGLPIVRGLVRRCGGEVRLGDGSEGGLCAELVLVPA